MRQLLLRYVVSPAMAFLCIFLGNVFAGDGGTLEHQHGTANAVASTTSYASMVGSAMNAMHAGMDRAPVNGSPDHDFAAMMIPHHQGAVEMAKAELLYGTDPVLRRLAQEIIVTQGQEIEVMQSALKKQSPPAASAR